MFVGQLTQGQKTLMLDAAIHLSAVDEDFSDREKETINQLCEEMQIPIRYEAEMNVTDVIAEMRKIDSLTAKRIMLIELSGLVLSDRVYDEREQELMLRITDALGFESSEAEKVIALVEEHFAVFDKMYLYIEGESADAP